MDDSNQDICNELRFEEGERATAYPDSRGYLTIAIGRCVDSRVPGAGLSSDERRYLLDNDVNSRRRTLLLELPWSATLNRPRFNVLLQMSFQDGVSGLLKFQTFLGFGKAGDYDRAADDLLATLYAKQAPARVKRLAEQFRTGISQYPNEVIA